MPTMPQVGTQYAGYHIDGVVGRGGMSAVYRARDPRLDRIVALKILSPDLAVDDVFRERFVRESRVAASLSHPNIIPIYDFGANEDLLYIVMRYIDGPDLKQLIRRNGSLSPRHSIRLLTQAARALDTAHNRGLIHRDVKAANFLIQPNSVDLDDHVYLTDFGLTKHSVSRSGLTGTGVFIGTTDYVAPEQIEGTHVDARTDIYSLGCVLFEMLTGRPPFEKDAEVAILYAHMHQPPPLASSVRSELPRSIDDVISKALAKAPQDRYQNCADLVVAAVAAFGGATSTSLQGTLSGSAGGADDDSGTVLSRSAATGTGSNFSDAKGTDGLDPARADRPSDVAAGPGAPEIRGDERAAPRRRKPGVIAGVVAAAICIGTLGVVLASGSGTSPSANSGSMGSGSMGHSKQTAFDRAITAARASTGSDGLNGNLGACTATAKSTDVVQGFRCSSKALDSRFPIVLTEFSTDSALYKKYEDDLQASRGSLGHNVGSCTGSRMLASGGGEIAWRHGNHRQAPFPYMKQMTSRASKLGFAGRVFCGYSGSPANPLYFIESTNDADRTLIRVQAIAAHDQVFAVWHGLHHTLVMSKMSGGGM